MDRIAMTIGRGRRSPEGTGTAPLRDSARTSSWAARSFEQTLAHQELAQLHVEAFRLLHLQEVPGDGASIIGFDIPSGVAQEDGVEAKEQGGSVRPLLVG
ncbi:MAG: hypothetical protein CMJ84_06975 [Planctomycetes bacterium]|jgi:hypothetical protein|nr:hypothetical protein [Planctomycetota bacterium]MDP6408269.1 hypothetical protein [Planctomycetota bacterium]